MSHYKSLMSILSHPKSFCKSRTRLTGVGLVEMRAVCATLPLLNCPRLSYRAPSLVSSDLTFFFCLWSKGRSVGPSMYPTVHPYIEDSLGFGYGHTTLLEDLFAIDPSVHSLVRQLYSSFCWLRWLVRQSVRPFVRFTLLVNENKPKTTFGCFPCYLAY